MYETAIRVSERSNETAKVSVSIHQQEQHLQNQGL